MYHTVIPVSKCLTLISVKEIKALGHLIYSLEKLNWIFSP